MLASGWGWAQVYVEVWDGDFNDWVALERVAQLGPGKAKLRVMPSREGPPAAAAPTPQMAPAAAASPVRLRLVPQPAHLLPRPAVPFLLESDGGWPAEFQPLRLQSFDGAEYELLRERFFTVYNVTSGARESCTRGGTLRVTTRVVGKKVAIAEWPRLRCAVEALHANGQHEEALRHLRCLRHYMTLVQHATLPRVLRGEAAAGGFLPGEVVSLLSDDEDANEDVGAKGGHSAPIDVDALEEILLGPAVDGTRAAKRIKAEIK